ncbi:hypothetical protein BDB00DRAFT_882951 [Zychaea mexicana]|uniref:uncharacterized protein n=1 Tax=Zychaea mexicana TaxID=64656 RepID=UPI0022FE1B2D|nr:uncharacterized protein BDB00DRAFT_882951 [Zychaea mexicana]KAI9493915.1 hypothetical protein BDB00DRAFT_882951 [Zychaea mexicana]
MDTPCWRNVKLATAKCICAAEDTDNDDDLLAAEILHALSGRLIKNNHGECMLEDSFAHQTMSRMVCLWLRKPGCAVFANGNPVITVIGTLELKVTYKQNPGRVPDYVKLAKKMKLVLH